MSDPHFLRYQRFYPGDLAAAVVPPTTEWLQLGDGTALHLFRHPAPTEQAAAAFVILHGAGGHGRMLAGLGAVAQRLGATSVAPDLPGYGHTVVPDRRGVTYDGWIAAVTEVVTAESERTGAPVVLVGGSMGGRLAVDVAHRAAGRVGAVLATCLLDPRQAEVRAVVARHRLLIDWGLPVMRATARLTDRMMVPIPWLAPIDKIANAPDLARTCRRDPLGAGGSVPLGFLRSWLDHELGYEPETFDACPVVLAHPGEDRWTPIEVSRRWFDRLQVEKELVVLEGCGHAPFEEPGVRALVGAMADTLELTHNTAIPAVTAAERS